MTPQEQPDSQAGDELDDIVNVSYGKATMLQQTPYIEAETKRQTKVAIQAYAERLATKRAIEELTKARDDIWHGDGTTTYMSDRIDELTATLTKEADHA